MNVLNDNVPPVALLVKNGCRLCAAAQQVASAAAHESGLDLELLHAEDHPELAAKHAEEIPVLFIDGVQRDFWVLDPQRVRNILARRGADQ